MTQSYYDIHAKEYAELTVKADMSPAYDRFLAYLPAGAGILDAGCGSGRDSLCFIKKGYDVTMLDASAGMCRCAEKLTGRRALCMKFDEIEFADRFDGIWACASLLHVSEKELENVLEKFHRALKREGVLYASWKYGEAERSDGERFYCDMTEEKLQNVLARADLFDCLDCWVAEDSLPSGREQKWLNVVLMKVEASPLLHANQADEAFVRVGDKTKKLSFQDRLTLMYAKGLRHFEDEPVYGATLEDIDLDFVAEYVHRIGYTKTAEEYLRQNKNFVNGDKISTAAILLFGKNPQHFFPRARIRFIRFDGIEAKVGKDMNVIKDVIFEGRILDQVQQAVDYIKIQMKERTYLGKDAVFVTEEEYGEFVRTEIVVNAATHRDYAITGTDIQIKMFDDRLEVDSPGSFAGMVKKENIRYTHFSRNPKIAAFLKDYGFVKEYGEGVDRMCRELNAIGLPDPVFDNNTFILKTTICSAAYEKLPIQKKEVGDSAKNVAIEAQEVGDSAKNVAIEAREVGDSAKNVAIEAREVGDSAKNVAIEMIPLSEVLRLCAIQNYNQATINNINRLYEDIELNQIFNTGYICKLFSCSSSGARKILARLRIIDVVVPVKGKGKGQYRFKYKSEM